MTDTLRYTIAQEDRVPLPRKLAYSAGVFAEPLFLGTIGNFLVLFYNGVLGVSATTVGLVLFFPRIWDAITDPFVGKWSDGCTSRYGRRRPFILWGGLATVVTYFLLWTPPGILTTDTAKIIYLLTMGILFFTAYTTFSIPYGALAIEMSPDYKERTSIMAIRKFCHGGGEMLISTMPFVGGYLALQLGREGDERVAYAAAGLVFALASAVLIIVTFSGTRERRPTQAGAPLSLWVSIVYTLRNRLFLRLTLSVFILVLSIMTLAAYTNYIFIYYLDNKALLAAYGMYGGILGMPLAFVWWFAANRIGKSRAIFLSQSIICVASMTTFVCFNRTYPYLAFITATLYAAGWSGILVLSPSMMADITDIDELETGRRREGSFGGVYGFIFKLGIAASTPLLGFGVDWAGFVPELGTGQSAQTFLILRLLCSCGSAVFALVALALLWRFPLTAERALEVRRTLEARRGKISAVR